MTTFSLYRRVQLAAWSGTINWASDSIVATQHNSPYLPNLDTDSFVSNLTGEIASGGGYAQGGLPLTGRTAIYYPAASWPDVWAPVTQYAAGQVVRPALNPALLFRCYQAGVSGGTAPVWPSTGGAVITDGTAAWAAVGAGAVALAASPLQWASYTASFRYLVISDRTPSSAAAQPLLAVADMGSVVTGSGGNLVVTFDSGSGSGIVIPLWTS